MRTRHRSKALRAHIRNTRGLSRLGSPESVAQAIDQRATRLRRAPLQGLGPARRTNFTYLAQRRRGLDPGGRYIARVRIRYTGSRRGDYAAAERILGRRRQVGEVWHHFHDYNSQSNQGTMYLMRLTDHSLPHSGGVWMYEAARGVSYGY